MVAQYVNELPENVQVLLAMRSAFKFGLITLGTYKVLAQRV